jgi:pimeloyl-ACP methyl ester carboxylesterase
LAVLSGPALLGILAVLTCRTPDVYGDAHGGAFREKPADRLIECEVRFTVHNPGVPGEATIHGTLIRPAKTRKATGTAVVLLHGAISDRTSWMGPIDGVPSMAHDIAKQGHAVFAIDRLGYGESVYDPFPGAGWAITTNTQVETIHEIVTQIRGGCYRVTDDASDRGSPARARGGRVSADRIVLVGISLGGGLAQCYATRYHDADAIVSLAWSNQPASEAIATIFQRFVIPQFLLGNDHAYFFPPSDGFSEECAWMFYEPGVDPDVLAAACTDGFFGTSPSGELATVGDMTAETIANIEKATTPVLLVYGDHDNFFPGPEYRGLLGNDADAVTPDITLWQGSKAHVDVLIVKKTGHAIPFHDRASQVTKKIVEWIGDH